MEKKRELMKKKAINFPLNLRHRRHKAEKRSAADPMKNETLESRRVDLNFIELVFKKKKIWVPAFD